MPAHLMVYLWSLASTVPSSRELHREEWALNSISVGADHGFCFYVIFPTISVNYWHDA